MKATPAPKQLALIDRDGTVIVDKVYLRDLAGARRLHSPSDPQIAKASNREVAPGASDQFSRNSFPIAESRLAQIHQGV
jgi:histidinol phosphatase-like enzyme